MFSPNGVPGGMPSGGAAPNPLRFLEKAPGAPERSFSSSGGASDAFPFAADWVRRGS